MNPNAIHILEANFDKINWCFLSKNPAVIHLLEANQDKIDWNSLSENSEAIHLLEANIDKINWYLLSKNPAIFELDYNAISSSIEVFKEELIQTVYNPFRVERMLIEYNYCLADDNYI